jgi:hypothetical protein
MGMGKVNAHTAEAHKAWLWLTLSASG